MASAIDATKPVAGNPTTESVRLNFAAAKSEIELLQQTAGVGPQGPIGPTGPSGTLSVGTVTTGPAGGSAAVTNSGTAQAAVLNFTLPRGDAGTGGSGITETQAKDAVRQGSIKFLESPETTAPTFPTTPNLAGAPVVGAGWTPATGGTATSTYTQTTGDSNPLAYPATIANGTSYQIVFGATTTAGPTGTYDFTNFGIAIYFRTGPTVTTGQQLVFEGWVGETNPVTVRATGNFSHVVVIPQSSNWRGTFAMTRVVAFTGAYNSVSLSIKDFEIRARPTSLYITNVGGGRLATGGNNVAFGSGAFANAVTATSSVAIGFNALSRGTSSGNVAVGHQAMQNLTGGYSNVAVGQYSMQYSETAFNNVSIGDYSMTYCANGYDTVAVGRYTQYWTVPSNAAPTYNNIAIGGWVGFYGNNNVGVGFQALAHSAGPPGYMKGNRTVGIGYQAGSHLASGQVSTADDSVFLGANTKSGGDAQTNQIVIGYNATGHGSNTITLGNSSITHLHCNVQVIDALSDTRVKENVQAADLAACLNAVKNLPVSQWDWLPISGAHANKHALGFMADDVAKVWPQAVSKEDAFLTVVNPDGTPQLTSVTDPGWTPPDGGPVVPASTRLIEKTQEFKDLQYVSLTEALPTLWGAVQKLIEKNDELEKKLEQLNPAGANPAAANPAPSTQSGGLFRRGRN